MSIIAGHSKNVILFSAALAISSSYRTLTPFSLQVMVAEALDIARETYFAILMDRSFGGPVMVGSPNGGVDIEEVAEKNPASIFKVNLIS